jgi:hypothetical protein
MGDLRFVIDDFEPSATALFSSFAFHGANDEKSGLIGILIQGCGCCAA